MYQKKYHYKDLSKLTFLITGGAGFIGSNLVEYLLKYNTKKIVVLDNFSTGNRKNIETFLKDDRCRLIEGDIRNFETCIKAVDGVDYILHQAALGSIPRSIKDPIMINEVNISGFLNMLVAAKESNTVKRMVYAASSSSYGDHLGLPKVEEKIGKPLSPYAVTKYVNELYADVFYKVYGLETIGLRYFNVFGPKQDPNGAYAAVIPKFIEQFLKKEDITINGDGKHSRDFTFIENIVQANIKAVLSENNEAVNQVYNIACGESIDLNKLVRTIKDYLVFCNIDVSSLNIRHVVPRPGDIKHSLADITKANKLIEYRPMFSFSDGINLTIQWFVNRKQAL